jgi:hypothetical protein
MKVICRFRGPVNLAEGESRLRIANLKFVNVLHPQLAWAPPDFDFNLHEVEVEVLNETSVDPILGLLNPLLDSWELKE